MEMWQTLPAQPKLRVTFCFDRCLAMPDHVGQPVTWRQVLRCSWWRFQSGLVQTIWKNTGLSLLATMAKWMMRVLVENMRQHPVLTCPDRSTRSVSRQVGGTTREAFWHARPSRRNLVMVSMDIRQFFDHMDVRRVIAALQARHFPRWLVRDVARDLCFLRARARIADADWTPELKFRIGRETGEVDTPALLNELLQHHLSSLAEPWHTHRTGYIIGGDGDDQEMKQTVLSHLCKADKTWLFASNITPDND